MHTAMMQHGFHWGWGHLGRRATALVSGLREPNPSHELEPVLAEVLDPPDELIVRHAEGLPLGPVDVSVVRHVRQPFDVVGELCPALLHDFVRCGQQRVPEAVLGFFGRPAAARRPVGGLLPEQPLGGLDDRVDHR